MVVNTIFFNSGGGGLNPDPPPGNTPLRLPSLTKPQHRMTSTFCTLLRRFLHRYFRDPTLLSIAVEATDRVRINQKIIAIVTTSQTLIRSFWFMNKHSLIPGNAEWIDASISQELIYFLVFMKLNGMIT